MTVRTVKRAVYRSSEIRSNQHANPPSLRASNLHLLCTSGLATSVMFIQPGLLRVADVALSTTRPQPRHHYRLHLDASTRDTHERPSSLRWIEPKSAPRHQPITIIILTEQEAVDLAWTLETELEAVDLAWTLERDINTRNPLAPTHQKEPSTTAPVKYDSATAGCSLSPD